MREEDDKIEIENFNAPWRTERVDRSQYEAMRDALLAVFPKSPPGMKVADAKEVLLPRLDQDLSPGGAKAGCWLKAAQLDLQPKAVIARAPVNPVHLYRLT